MSVYELDMDWRIQTAILEFEGECYHHNRPAQRCKACDARRAIVRIEADLDALSEVAA